MRDGAALRTVSIVVPYQNAVCVFHFPSPPLSCVLFSPRPPGEIVAVHCYPCNYSLSVVLLCCFACIITSSFCGPGSSFGASSIGSSSSAISSAAEATSSRSFSGKLVMGAAHEPRCESSDGGGCYRRALRLRDGPERHAAGARTAPNKLLGQFADRAKPLRTMVVWSC